MSRTTGTGKVRKSSDLTRNKGDLENLTQNQKAGEILIEWLTAQLLTDNDSACDDGPSSEGDSAELGRHPNTFVRDTSDELLGPNQPAEQDCPVATADCMPPPRLKKHTEYVNNEVDSIQRESDILRERISLTNDASKKITQVIKLLRRAVFQLDSNIRTSDETLSELSINADTCISSALNSAQELLHDFGFSTDKASNYDFAENHPNSGQNQDFQIARVFLQNVQNAFSNITRSLQRYLDFYQKMHENENEQILYLQDEAERLSEVFDSSNSAPKGGRGSPLTEELENICVLLEYGTTRESAVHSSNGRVDVLLSTFEDSTGISKASTYSVEQSLQLAWTQDQAFILKLHQEIIDNVISTLDSMCLPLERLHSSLSTLACCAQDSEATLEAFGEELGDIHVDRIFKDDQSENLREKAFEEQLKIILSNTRASHSDEIMLLNRADILAQISFVKDRYINLETAETTWADGTIREYSMRPIHPGLAQVYPESPSSSCPAPFDFPADLRVLEQQTRSKTKDLQNVANSLEEEAREIFVKDTYSKRFNAFVDKWSGSNNA